MSDSPDVRAARDEYQAAKLTMDEYWPVYEATLAFNPRTPGEPALEISLDVHKEWTARTDRFVQALPQLKAATGT